MSEGDSSQETLDRAAHVQDWLLHHGGFTYENDVDRCLLGLGFTLEDGSRPCGSFSGGEQMRLKLGRALIDPAGLLLLDEPGNHLDDTQREWLGEFLRSCPRAFVVVTHDPEILEGAVNRVACLIEGKVYTFRGDFASFETQFEEMQKSRERAYEHQQAFIERTEEFIRRYKAGQRSKQARGREKVLSRLERVQAPLRMPEGFKLNLAFEEIPGEDVLQVAGLRIGMGARELLVEKLHLKRGQKVALIGANGSGKTTLLRALTGEVGTLEGEIRWGTNVRVAHYDQHQRRLPFTGSLFAAIGELLKTPHRESIMTYLGAFGFGGSRAEQNVGSLSGGERARLHLLAVLLAKANVLLLDEPTNHLDRPAVDMLREALQAYKGTIVLVSHEEDFLKAVTGVTWAVSAERILCAAGFAPDLLAAEAAGETKAEEPPAESPRDKPQKASATKKGLSKNELFRLQKRKTEMDESVAALASEKDALEKRFMRPDSIVTEDWRALHTRFEEVKKLLAAAEEEWLSLSVRLESHERDVGR